MPEVVTIGDCTLYRGDCLEVLPTLGRVTISTVIADPPYGINTKSDGSGKLNPWADLCNSALWYRAWFEQCRRVLMSNGCFWSFLNWRSLVTFQKAACDAAWPIESLLVWNKDWIGPGGSRGLRPSYELVALWVMPEFSIEDRGVPDVQTFAWSSHKPNGHPAEKPSTLVSWLIEQSSSGVVLDPFMGSGTTAEACVSASRPFVGIELDQHWFDVACHRIENAYAKSALFEPPPPVERQGAIFEAVP